MKFLYKEKNCYPGLVLGNYKRDGFKKILKISGFTLEIERKRSFLCPSVLQLSMSRGKPRARVGERVREEEREEFNRDLASRRGKKGEIEERM